MKRVIGIFSILVLVIAAFVWLKPLNNNTEEDHLAKLKPSDWMMMQRMYPYETISPGAYEQAREQAIELKQQAALFKSGQEDWELIGPFNVGGRITDVEMHSTDTETIYACAASGGVYKSSNKGTTWEQIFESTYTQSIGDLGMAETDANLLYLGTGEPNGGQGSITYDGYGMFKSTDAGATWTHVGLENAGGIGRVEVDPTNGDRVFVACMGNLFSKNAERGIYRTTDGGQTWENVLFISDSTGGIDLCINPNDPNIVYAAMWERVRYPHRRTYGGPSSGIYKTTDGGDTWIELTNGLPDEDLGRVGLDISKSNPDIVYAVYANATGTWKDIFKTVDGGTSWTATNSNLGGTTYFWWFSKINVDPINPNIVYSGGFHLHKTTNGGDSWSRVNGLHVDQHGVFIHPKDNALVVMGNDGGVYISTSGSASYYFIEKLPITQFYTCEVNYQRPEQAYGGTQDNGTVRTLTGRDDDWRSIYGGDGFIVRVDPTDSDYVYASSQRGGFGRSTDGGNRFIGGKNGITGSNRFNWKTPYILDPNDPKIMYIGSQKVYKSTNRAANWTAISGDLTNGAGAWNYGTLTALAVSPIDGNILYAGSDDGNVWVATDGGVSRTWTKISDDLPVRWVTTIQTDPFDVNTAYVGFSGIRYHDPEPHIFRTTDLGATWEDISSNLPDIPVNNITIDPDNQGTFYVATDHGVYVTYDAGDRWEVMGNGMPTVPVLDLKLHQPTRTLVAATFGRSMYKINLKASSSTGDIESETAQLNAYPIPALNEVTIQFILDSPQTGKLLIYNMTGQVVSTLHDGDLPQGKNTFTWDGKTDQGRASGNYICRLVTSKTILSKRIQIL